MTARNVDADLLKRARADVDVFARALVGEPLWRHQIEVLRSDARIRCICSGRQAGKSRTLAIAALHHAFANPESVTLVISAGEDAARDLLASVSMLAAAPLLQPSVSDETAAQITISNGSVVRSVPASQKQVRGKSVDLLIIDEAAFVEEEIWTAARYTMLARSGSRVIMASTPFGRRDRFFAVNYHAGLGRRPPSGYRSWHWPSTVSPLVDKGLIDMWRSTTTDREYRSEILAEWVDEAGAYFTSAELEAGTRDYELVDPKDAERRPAVAGVDWGFAHDANALAIVAECGTHDFPGQKSRDGTTYFVPWLEEHFRLPYSKFVDRVVRAAVGSGDVGRRDAERALYGRSSHAAQTGHDLQRITSEMNGVGAAPTELLGERLRGVGVQAELNGVHTDNRLKEALFGTIKLLLQQGRLLLPRHTTLLRQLSSLEYETTESGMVRIAVPTRLGHDDLAIALALAVNRRGAAVGPDVGIFPARIVGGRYRDLRFVGTR